MGQVGVEPVLALGQRLRMGNHHLDIGQRGAEPQNVVAHQQADFAHDMQGRVQQQIQRARDHPFGRVFNRHHAKLGAARGGGPKHFINAGAHHPFDAGAKVLQRRLLGEGAGGAEVGDPLGRFQRAAGRHDFTPDDGHAAVFERPRVACLQAADDLGFAFRAEHRGVVHAFDLADFMGQGGPLVQQGQQLQIKCVDLDA